MFPHLLNLFYPKICAGCKCLLLGNESVICTVCRHEMPLTQFHLHPENEGFKKFYGRLDVAYVSCFLYYQKKGIVQEMIHALKYRGHQEIGTMLGEWYAHELKTASVLYNIDVIVPVPLHKKKLKKRGYNQVTTFCKALSAILEIPCDGNILIKKAHSAAQSGKTFSERTRLDDDAFGVQYNESHHGKHFLLIDDVLTTGTTLENCGRCLLKIPGARLSIITIAISHS